MFDGKKNIEIVSGNGKDLNLSDVEENISIATPEEDSNVKKNIIIPAETK